jgi:hypothetical protein
MTAGFLVAIAGCGGGGGGNSGGGSTQLIIPTLTFATIPPQTYGDPPFTVSATSASNGAVIYTVTSGPASVSGNTVTLTGAGTIALSASQAASGDYAATTATTSIVVSGDKEWTCEFGCIGGYATGLYGTIGVAGSGTPPGRFYTVGWTDNSGNLWLFGGGDAIGFNLNDLWEFSPSTQKWTWVTGNTEDFNGTAGPNGTIGSTGVYGTLGTPAPGNTPGARNGSVGWTDSSNNFWLFGGSTYVGMINDLWKFSPSIQEWAWMGGSNTASTAVGTGVYGTLGVASAGNIPGGRGQSVSWTDKSGDFWLFGGWVNGGNMNDLWEYSPATNEWTWMSGSKTINATGIYGTLGIATAGNSPGARYGAVSWTDNDGNLWLFGGYGLDSNGSAGYLNDLWEFGATNNEWAWVSGSSTVNATGIYGALGIAASSNVPGARMYSVGWTDSLGDIWLFSGTECSTSGNACEQFNDLWKFNPSTKEWTWSSGSSNGNASSVYGNPGTPAPGNVPGGRYGAVRMPEDHNGNLWLFGGVTTNGYPNDLWSYQP